MGSRHIFLVMYILIKRGKVRVIRSCAEKDYCVL